MDIPSYLAQSGLTLTSFAERAGVSVAAMSRYARGRQIPRPEVMRRLIEASGRQIGPDDFYLDAPVPDAPATPAPLSATTLPAGPGPSPGAGDFAWVDLMISDLNGIARGKRIPAQGYAAIRRSGIRMVGSIYALDVEGHNVEGAGLAMSTGDSDQVLMPLDDRLRPALWAQEPTAIQLMSMVDASGRPYFAEPRAVLGRVLSGFAELGLTPCVACELEFYLVDPPGGDGRPRLPSAGGLRRGGAGQVLSLDETDRYAAVIGEAMRASTALGAPAKGALSEYGPGQWEINLGHTTDALDAADQAILMKRAVKGIARRHGLEATFMAKPWRDYAGSGLHMHLSLLDRDGRNVFAGEGAANRALSHALGGLQATLAEAVAILAPNANSFRRMVPASYAPMGATWGFENRTVALRIPGGDPAARRIEHRVAGADANPYLALATLLAGVHFGLTEGRAATAPVDGNAYDRAHALLPRRWAEALDRFEAATILPRYLSPDYCQLYAACRRQELDDFESEITPLEYERYLTTI
ncbi:helix-turn-helix domain-containing protein [Zavarzinia sp. CC-PAN008]|uniref:helix-turn-helix domain-containing protein n=1 Tax=Zavarzinia sp. CC-PAN008 TaxID=3243332 RepID=UPI003F749D57